MKKIRVTMLGPSLYQQGGMATVENLIVDYRSEALVIQHISTHEEGSSWRRIQIFLIALWQFLGQLIFNQVDIAHVHVSERGSVYRVGVLVFFANLFAKPIVIHTHGCEFHVFFEGLSAFRQALVRLIFQRATYVIALSQSWKQYYTQQCRLNPHQVLVMLNPVQLPRKLPDRVTHHNHRIQFILLGRIGQRKGAFDAIQAVAQLPAAQRCRMELWLAGDGEVEKAQALIHRLGLQDRVKMLGWIDSATRDRLLSQADVFLLPSYNEGLPVSMVESMAWGLPVIVTPVGGILDLVIHHKHGFVVNPGNVAEITAAMQTLIQDDRRRLAMGRAARQQVSALDIVPYHQQLVDLYTAAISTSGSGGIGNALPRVS
jgi:glycosyltransferase involved in cell wall biosynthesis